MWPVLTEKAVQGAILTESYGNFGLGFTFLHYAPELTGVPLGPELMHRWGELVRPLLFRRSATDR